MITKRLNETYGEAQNNSEAYMDGSKSKGKKVCFASVLLDSTRRGFLPKKASLHIIEITATKAHTGFH